jgi:hypothetical protein
MRPDAVAVAAVVTSASFAFDAGLQDESGRVSRLLLILLAIFLTLLPG